MFTVALGIVVLLIALMLDSNNFRFIVKPEYQVIVGTIVIAVIIFDEALSGLLLGLAVIIMYTRVIARKAGIKLDIMDLLGKTSQTSETQKSNYKQETPLQNGSPMRKLVKETNYITPSNLVDAQNNIIDTKNYTNTYVGIPEMYGKPVYSAEGTDTDGETDVQGYDSGIYIGSSVKN